MSKSDNLREKYVNAVKNVLKIAEENSPVRVKAEYIGCKNCGSRLAKKYIHMSGGKFCSCPVCSASLFSNTAQERIKKAEEKAEKLRKELKKEEEKEKYERKPSFENSLKETRERFDYILEEHRTPDFTEIVGKMGGDTLTFRVYKDGNVYER